MLRWKRKTENGRQRWEDASRHQEGRMQDDTWEHERGEWEPENEYEASGYREYLRWLPRQGDPRLQPGFPGARKSARVETLH